MCADVKTVDRRPYPTVANKCLSNFKAEPRWGYNIWPLASKRNNVLLEKNLYFCKIVRKLFCLLSCAVITVVDVILLHPDRYSATAKFSPV